MDRKTFFKDAFSYVVGKSLDSLSNNVVVDYLEDSAKQKQRPPGANPSEEGFLKACIGCDRCMQACPHNLIMVEDMEKRDPLIYPEEKKCVMCEDFPCIKSCPEANALSFEFDREPREL
ncbi:MAG: 4Fe-4S dicluster domain-containing protein [Chlamydiales bacterium]|nr:4Fe-4S dicluster domain-containing protein [Chlamydiales bacterium]NCF70249.1 4Fe-4S dicluster domain-containing protein [Chlamydiales bacterium]